MSSDPTAAYADPSLPDRQREREPVAMQRATDKGQRIAAAGTMRQAGPLILAARNARTVRQRVIWMHRAASAWAKAFEPLAACRKGCAHCCRIPLTISRTEAEILSQASGRPIAATAKVLRSDEIVNAAQLAAASAELKRWSDATPCPFLVDEACSVYEARPLACRAQLNLDDDELLCLLAKSRPANVPYANWHFLVDQALAVEPGVILADVRDFFPPESTS